MMTSSQLSSIPRLGVLWCPNWAVVAAGSAADEPVVVLHANRVIANSLAAGREGIVVGQRRRQAQACCPDVRLVAHDPDADARRFESVVTAISALIPRVEITEPGMLSFLAKGPSRYFGGEAAMAERMINLATSTVVGAMADSTTGQSLAAVGGFGIGIAQGPFPAAIAAKQAAALGRAVIVPSGVEATASFLAPLPAQLLASVAGLDDEFVELLQRLPPPPRPPTRET